MNKTRKNQFTPGVGSSSIITVFLLLCLITFSTLSLISASADMKLTQKVVTMTQAYYDAENKAYAHLAKLDSILVSSYHSGVSTAGYYESIANELQNHPELHLVQNKQYYRVYFYEEISQAQNLMIGVEINYPQAGEIFYHIIQWENQSAGEWIPEEGISLLGRK